MATPPAGEAHKSHKSHGPLVYDMFRDVNSLQLHPPIDQQERLRQAGLTHKVHKNARLVRQLINVLVGVAVGLAAVVVAKGSDTIADWRVGLLETLLDKVGGPVGTGDTSRLMLAALVSSLVCASLSLVAALFVVWEPRSASSGIPGVIAFLNGCDLRGGLGRKVLISKVFGTICAVSAGLCVGPEGPMIHIGTILGLMVVRKGIRPFLRWGGPGMKALEEEIARAPLRNEIQAGAMGAGAGIAGAFSAPLAGTMFVVEEASSYFSKKMFFHTFVTCVFAAATAMIVDAWIGMSLYTFYNRYTTCMGEAISISVLARVFLTAVICAFFGLAFNAAVVKLNSARVLQNRRLTGAGRKAWVVRVGEVVAIAIITGAVTVILPATQPCRDSTLQNVFDSGTGCYSDDWLLQIMSGTQSGDFKHPTQAFVDRLRGSDNMKQDYFYQPSGGLFGAQYNPQACPIAIVSNPDCAIKNVTLTKEQQTTLRTEYYCCGFTNLSDYLNGPNKHLSFDRQHPVAPLVINEEVWPRGVCDAERYDVANHVDIPVYSPGAALWMVRPQVVARVLLSRGSSSVLPPADLGMFLVGYTTLTAISAGLWVPGGLLVPQMVIGASAGRLIAELWNAIEGKASVRVNWMPEVKPLFDALGRKEGTEHRDATPEPGILALAGAAAFLASSGALALFVLVLFLEITLDWSLVPVIITAVIAARLVVSVLGKHGLYHRLIDVQSLPFLDDHWHWRAEQIMSREVLEEDLRSARLVAAHSGQPEPASIENLVLSVRRGATVREVKQLLDQKLIGELKATVQGFPVVHDDDESEGGILGGTLCGLVSREALVARVAAAQTESPESPAPNNRRFSVMRSPEPTFAGSYRNSTVRSEAPDALGIEDIMDTAPFVVQATTPVSHVHMLIRQVGARHVVVVDCSHRPLGVLTRKSLMPWRYPEMDHHDGHDSFADTRLAAHLGGMKVGAAARTSSAVGAVQPRRRGTDGGAPMSLREASPGLSRSLEASQHKEPLLPDSSAPQAA